MQIITRLLPFRKYQKNFKERKEKMSKTTPMKAIRQKCLDCCNGQIKEIRECTIKTCPLHVYRTGHRPKEEQERTE
jgi:hypothetical protein